MRKIMLILWMSLICGCGPYLTYEQEHLVACSAAFAAHPEWSERTKQDIRDRRLRKKMSAEQVSLAWGMNLKCVHAGSVRMMYEGRNCVSAYAQALLRNKNYDQMNYGLLHGTYTFWFTDEGLEDWSWSEYCYYDY